MYYSNIDTYVHFVSISFRLLWLVICIISLALSVFWTYEAWINWKTDPIITTVLDTGNMES